MMNGKRCMIGYRKFILCSVAVSLITGFVVSGHIDGNTFGTALASIVVAFCTANLTEHVTNAVNKYIEKRK